MKIVFLGADALCNLQRLALWTRSLFFARLAARHQLRRQMR